MEQTQISLCTLLSSMFIKAKTGKRLNGHSLHIRWSNLWFHVSILQFSDGNCEGGVLRLRGAIEIHQLHFWKLLQNPVRQAPRQRFAHTHDALQTTQSSAVQHQFQHRRCNDLSTSHHSSAKSRTLSGRNNVTLHVCQVHYTHKVSNDPTNKL